MARRERTSDNERRIYLLNAGWLEVSPGHWEHPELEHSWPIADAYDLHREAMTCPAGAACKTPLTHKALVDPSPAR